MKLVIILLAVVSMAFAMEFSVDKGSTVCFTETLVTGATCAFEVGEKNSSSFIFEAHGPGGLKIVSELRSGSRAYAFTAEGTGEFNFCFLNDANTVGTAVFNIDTGSVAEQRVQRLTTKELMAVDKQSLSLENNITAIHRDFLFQRRRYSSLIAANEQTRSTLIFMAVVLTLGLGAINGLQLMIYRRYMRQKLGSNSQPSSPFSRA